jgi:hypothetical protein
VQNGASVRTGSLVFATSNAGAPSERVRIDSSGRLLVGSTFAYDSATFCVTSAVGQNRIIGFDGGGSGARARFFVDAPALSQINLVVDGAGTMGFVQNATEMARFDSSRNFLVGTTSANPQSLSSGSGAQVASGGNFFNAVSGDRCATFNRTSNDGNIIEFARSGSVKGSVSISGSTTTYNTSSDYRLKENIAPMTGALTTIAQLKPVTYDWIADKTKGQGFIAHELQAVVPDCVTGAKDAVDADGNPVYQGIDTSFLVATLTAAIQELKAINDTQAETINALTARVVALEAK